MFFFGDAELDPHAEERLNAFCQIYAPVLGGHLIEADETERVHLVLDQDGSTSHAEVVLDGRTGFGSRARSREAIASAAVAAVSTEAKLASVGEVRGDDGAAAYVVAVGEAGRLGMGAAPIVPASGVPTAIAVASVRAARELQA